jgi:hypothetical protein
MATVLIDRAGFIARRLIPILAKQGEEVVCMDIKATFDWPTPTRVWPGVKRMGQ